MSANYVAKELGYGAADEWAPFDAATNAAFEPLETFAGRFDDLLATITGIGFDTIDLWFAHLNWRWATPDHVSSRARRSLATCRSRRLARRQRRRDDRRSGAACRLANDLDVDLIAGVGEVVHVIARARSPCSASTASASGWRTIPRERRRRCSTRSATTPTCSAPPSTRAGGRPSRTTPSPRSTSSRIASSTCTSRTSRRPTHVSCMHGEGCANIAGCVEKLLAIGYSGPVSIEHEPYDRDPTDECVRMLARIREQLAATEAGHRV